MPRYMLSIAFLVAALGSVQAGEQEGAENQVANIAAGEEIYQEVCRNCHGPKAQGIASYPKLADKSVDYITERLERYRAGEKIGPNSMLMIPHARELSDEDIANLANYITTAFQ